MNYLDNPGRRDVAAAVGWIHAGLQVMHPGQRASAHRHSASAIRFIMEGTGACTIVDGHKMTLGHNDLVLAPNGIWHEHANASATGDACLFCLNDLPVMRAVGLYREQAFGENGGQQPLL